MTYTYDANGRVISATDEDGRTVTTEYDNLGNVISQRDNSGTKVFESTYDALGNIIKNTDALGNSTTNNYDNLGRLIEIVDKMGRITKLNYDNDNRLIEVTDPLKGVTKQSYNADGNVKTMTDANNNSTTFDYDLAGNLIRETTAMGSQVSYGYNSRNLLSEMVNGRGQNISYEYDALGRIIKTTFPEGTVSYNYDANGNITEVTDANGTIKREYDALNRVTKYIDARGKVISYEYNELGNLINITYPDGKKVYYEYSAGGKLEKVTDWAKRETKYEYDANGRLAKTTRANGTVETLTYDVAGQIIEILDVDKDGNVINRYTFQYDANGNVIKEDKGTSNSVPYIPDDVIMTYDSNNRLITYNGKEIQYDADGNMITVPLNGEMVQCTYDSRNRLITAGNTMYVYDAENNRIAIVENGQGTNYTVNVLGKLNQVLVRTDANGNDTYYVYGLGLIAEEDSNGNYRTYHYDRRGSTTAITDEEGKITDRIEYGPYGELLSKTGNTDTTFLYNGRYGVITDSNGLYYMRARYYNPDIKRFINQDVVLGNIASSVTMNRYTYANGNPISNIDPFGLSADGDDIIHGILDFFGMMPVVGVIFDGANTLFYLAEGDYVNGALSGISMMPWGDIVGKGAKFGKEALEKGVQIGRKIVEKGRRWVNKVVRRVSRYADDATKFFSKRSTKKVVEEIGEGACFVAGTKITTDAGDVCIEDIKVGDRVYSENVETSERGFKKVVRVFVKETDVLVHLDIEGIKIDTTENHPFWVEEKGWVRAADLKPGDMVTLKDGRRSKVTSVTIERLAVPVKVYNFEVEDWHTYFVSEIGVLVHNKCWVDNIEGVAKAEPFDIVKYGDKTPGIENHHGVLDVWAKNNIPGYVGRAKDSTSIALTAGKEGQHAATKAVYRDWLFEKTGKKVGGKVDWTNVSPREIQDLSERMFDAAGVPSSARTDYYREFNKYIYGLD